MWAANTAAWRDRVDADRRVVPAARAPLSPRLVVLVPAALPAVPAANASALGVGGPRNGLAVPTRVVGRVMCSPDPRPVVGGETVGVGVGVVAVDGGEDELVGGGELLVGVEDGELVGVDDEEGGDELGGVGAGWEEVVDCPPPVSELSQLS